MLDRRVHRRTKIQRKVVLKPVQTGRRSRWIFGPLKSPVPAVGNIFDLGCGGMSGTFSTSFAVGTVCDVRIEGTTGKVQRTRGTVRDVRGTNGAKMLGIAFKEPLVALGDPARKGPDVPRNGIDPFALVVDDEPSVRTILRCFLEGRGMRVETAPGGTEALDILHKEEPTLMMLDLKMPGISGVQLLETMNAEGLRVPNIWAMSGYVTDEEALAALSLGASEFLNKPFDLDHLDFSLQLLTPMM